MTIRSIENDYLELKKTLAVMSEDVAGMVRDSVKALLSGDAELARSVMAKDAEVDELEINVDEICTKIIALYEPKATDLRYIITALRIIVDMERVGDHAKIIAKQSIKLASAQKLDDIQDLQQMADNAVNMIQDAIKAFFTKDEALANKILENDEIIDSYQSKIIQTLIQTIMNDVTKTKSSVKLINVVRRLERIADHAKNIAELVSFMVSGKMRRKDAGAENA